LRLIGNVCIDDTTAQELAAEHLSKLAKALECDENFEVAIGAISNIYSDDVVSHIQAVELGIIELITSGLATIHQDLIKNDSPVVPGVLSFVGAVIKSTLKDGSLQPLATSRLINSIIRLPMQEGLDEESYDDLMDVTLELIKDEKIQQEIAKFHQERNAANPLHNDPVLSALELLDRNAEDIDPYEEGSHIEAGRVRIIILWLQSSLGDIAFNLEYPTVESLFHDPLIPVIRKWLDAPFNTPWRSQHLKTCAFLVLANFANMAGRPDLSIAMVERQLHRIACDMVNGLPALKVTRTTRHAAVGFLRNLAMAKENKAVIRDLGIVDALLNYPNDRRPSLEDFRLLRELAQDDAHTCEKLLNATLFNAVDDETDAHTKLELTRMIITILRTSQHDPSAARPDAFMTAEMASSLLWLIRNAPGSPLAAEGWLGLALASKTVSGATLVYQALRAESPAFMTLNQTIDARDRSNIQVKEADNALVVVSQLTKPPVR
jgi:hypothetical protein